MNFNGCEQMDSLAGSDSLSHGYQDAILVAVVKVASRMKKYI